MVFQSSGLVEPGPVLLPQVRYHSEFVPQAMNVAKVLATTSCNPLTKSWHGPSQPSLTDHFVSFAPNDIAMLGASDAKAAAPAVGCNSAVFGEPQLRLDLQTNRPE